MITSYNSSGGGREANIRKKQKSLIVCRTNVFKNCFQTCEWREGNPVNRAGRVLGGTIVLSNGMIENDPNVLKKKNA